jgi:hypothetical protein
MGALNSTLTFELETLSQHMHLIERLQDKIFAQSDFQWLGKPQGEIRSFSEVKRLINQLK